MNYGFLTTEARREQRHGKNYKFRYFSEFSVLFRVSVVKNKMEFLAPHFLWLGLLALGIPIFIHFLTRERLRQVQFTLTRFVLPSRRRITRFRRFQHWWLFFLRALLIGLIAFALSHPVYKSLRPPAESKSFPAEPEQNVVIILDDSASMQYRERGKSLFSKAKLHIIKLFKNYPSLTQFTLINCSQNPRIILQNVSAEEIEKALEKLAPSFSRTALSGAVALAAQVLRTSPAKTGELIVVSDFQATAGDELYFQQFPEIISGVNFIPVRIGPEEKSNVRITDLALESPDLIGVNRPFNLRVKVCNDSPSQVTKNISLRINQEPQLEKEIVLNPDEKKWISFPLVCNQEGAEQGIIGFKKHDAFKLDDQYHFAFSVQPKIKALLLGEKIEDNYYLKSALNPFSEPEGKVKVISESILHFKAQNLQNYDLVVFNNVGRISSVVKERLDKYLLNGGKVLIFLGNNVDPVAYNTLLGELLPGKIGGILSEGKITNSVYREIDLGEVSFFKFYQVDPAARAYILAIVNHTEPVLLQQARFAGQVVLGSFCDQREWSDIFIHPAYPVLIQKLVNDLCIFPANRQWLVGDVVQQEWRSKPGLTDSQELTVVGPTGNSDQIQIEANDFVYKTTGKPGIYQVYSGDKLLDCFAVNIDPRETDLRTIDLERVKELLIPDESGAISPEEQLLLPVAPVSAASSQLMVESGPKYLQLWQIILLVAILLFIIECWAQNFLYRTK